MNFIRFCIIKANLNNLLRGTSRMREEAMKAYRDGYIRHRIIS